MPGPECPSREGTNRLIVKLHSWEDGADSFGLVPARLDRLSETAGVQLSYLRPISGGAHVFRLPEEMPLPAVEAIASRLQKHPDVFFAEPDPRLWPALVPDDPRYAEQWHYHEAAGGARLPEAWDMTTGSPDVVVAVLDTGVLLDHPDLVGRTLPGFDFIRLTSRSNDGDWWDADPSDPGSWSDGSECPAANSTWHGTHMAGTIGAATNNGVGVAGVNWASMILPVRIVGACGAFVGDLVDGMRWAAGYPIPPLNPDTPVPINQNPAHVLNLSLDVRATCGIALQNAIDDVVARGALVVAAAGNSNADAADYSPANCSGVLAVGAVTRTGARALYSNKGPLVGISAPGGVGGSTNAVLSTMNTGSTVPANHSYGGKNGTSMAAAHVSGIASLVFSVNPGLTGDQVMAMLKQTARPFPDSTCDPNLCGAGIVDAAAAVQAALGSGTPPLANAGPDQTVSPGASVALSGSGTDDGAIVAYAWTQTSGTVVALNGANTATPSFTAPSSPQTLTFRLTVTDDEGLIDTDLVNVTVASPNSPPVPSADPIVTQQDVEGETQVRPNDPDPGDRHTYTVSTPPTHGTAVVSATGLVRYTPNAGYSGPDTLDVRVADSAGASGTVSISVTVTPTTPTNNPPVAQNGSLDAAEDSSATGTLSATDADGDGLTYRIVANGGKGTAVVTNASTGAYRYTPTANANGADTFTFRANDGAADSNLGTVTVNITPVNDLPVAADDTATTVEDEPVTVAVLSNDTDVDGDSLMVSVATQGTRGAVTINADQTITYSPAANLSGSDTFTYTASDGKGGTDTGAVAITINSVNDAPLLAGIGPRSAVEGQPFTIGLSATDVDGDTLRFAATNAPAGSSLTDNGDGTATFSWTPEFGDRASYSVTFRVNDDGTPQLSDSESVTITVGAGTVTVSIPLQTGWNLISHPVAACSYVGGAPPSVPLPEGVQCTPVASIADVFPGIAGKYDLIRSFDADGAHTYDPGLPDYLNDLTYVAGGYGYWIRMNQPAVLTFEGERLPPAASLTLSAGWNLVGYWGTDVRYVGAVPTVDFPAGVTYTQVSSISDVFVSLGASTIAVWSTDANGDHTYDPEIPESSNDLKYVGPGYGYWVKVSAPSSLDFGSP